MNIEAKKRSVFASVMNLGPSEQRKENPGQIFSLIPVSIII